MRLSHKHRFVFFSFPKTGSESVRLALDPITDERGGPRPHPGSPPLMDPPVNDHITPMELREIFRDRGWPFAEYFRFVFVRNPWSRLVSVYRMIRRTDRRFTTSFGDWLIQSRPFGRGGCEDGREGEDTQRFRRYGTYTLDSFVSDENGVRLVDQVYRLEDMPRMADELRRRGLPVPAEFIPAINRAEPVDLNRFYTPALISVVAMRYAKDIAEFGYTYPG